MFRLVEIFSSIQGEGSRVGAPAIFVRLTGCNLWNGMEANRAEGKGECSAWCDTQFAQGEEMEVTAILDRISSLSQAEEMIRPLVVFTGGEPLLQFRFRPYEGTQLLEGVRAMGGMTSLETNGTRIIPEAHWHLWDHVTISPKGMKSSPGSVGHLEGPARILAMAAEAGSRASIDLKVVVPSSLPLAELLGLFPSASLFIQPRDSGDRGLSHLGEARRLAARHGGRISIQTHKLLDLP